ncbi:hypothetical protein AB0L04_21655 [Streptomyces glaucescens]|uniref:hypothetical protein n=1 Tax=Streptomyces glaucescens TaxID=1907 RepID=UPI00344E3EFD
MQMNSVPQHLLSEDRQEYERLLDEALRSAPHRPELAAAGQRFTTEQLRTMALSATALITAAAATEYQHYVRIRAELRRPAPAATTPGPAPASGSEEPGPDTTGLAGTVGEAAETVGAGAVAMVAVLAPLLAATAAAIFLLVGYVVQVLDPGQAFARTMLTTGWVFAAVTALAILAAATGLLLTALRNRPAPEPGPYGEPTGELARARDAWHEALLERGIVPFLRDALAGSGADAPHRTVPPAPTSRIPQLGYDRPGFTSPGDGSATGSRPSYTSPDYTSPEFGGPEHRPR